MILQNLEPGGPYQVCCTTRGIEIRRNAPYIEIRLVVHNKGSNFINIFVILVLKVSLKLRPLNRIRLVRQQPLPSPSAFKNILRANEEMLVISDNSGKQIEILCKHRTREIIVERPKIKKFLLKDI